MSLMMDSAVVSILCVDDNRHVADALRMKFALTGGFDWKGWLPDARDLLAAVKRLSPDIVVLDVDMPGRDPFEAMAEVDERCPQSRVVMFSGHVRRELVDKAVGAGAWGYVSKNDGEDALISAVRAVMQGEFAVSPEVRSACDFG